MIIECPKCDAKVDGKILASKIYRESEDGDRTRTSFLECPVCHGCIVADQDEIQTGYNEMGYSVATRLWPEPSASLHVSIPRLARQSLGEAKRCFDAKAYAACAVMCRRAIEAICAEHKTKSKNLAAGLKELLGKKVIDQRLFEWGDALRQQGNIGAHANEEDISRENAHDVLDFALGICEYVFVLSEKYEEFQARQKKKSSIKMPVRKVPPRPPTSLVPPSSSP
jgi:hypothetical protein